jgi:hypothetical protein
MSQSVCVCVCVCAADLPSSCRYLYTCRTPHTSEYEYTGMCQEHVCFHKEQFVSGQRAKEQICLHAALLGARAHHCVCEQQICVHAALPGACAHHS